jgi:DNA helicase-4
MPRSIGPGIFGAYHNPLGKWDMRFDAERLILTVPGKKSRFVPLLDLESAIAVKGEIWARIEIVPPLIEAPISGVTFPEARRFVVALTSHAAKIREVAHAKILSSSDPAIDALVTSVDALLSEDRYLSLSDISKWRATIESEPGGAVIRSIMLPGLRTERIPRDTRSKVERLRKIFSGYSAETAEANERFVTAEAARYTELFDRIGSRPLSEEQRRICVAVPDRHLVVASAGSGKTSTIVGKVAYLLKSGVCRPEELLLLAFNKAAAEEIVRRIKRDLPTIPHLRHMRIKTFHAFGSHVISAVSKGKPTLHSSEGADPTSGAIFVTEMIDQLCRVDPEFSLDWLRFRIGYSHPASNPFDRKRFARLEDWAEFVGQSRLVTMNGEVVKSHGELAIANWLFINGVPYVYEKPYEHSTATTQKRQYHPDFYLPDVGVYLEHFAIGPDNAVPEIFEGPDKHYSNSMQWKRTLHKKHGTKLIETTFADFISGRLFEKLAELMRKIGQPLKPFSEAEMLARINRVQPVPIGALVRTFIRHLKGNGIDLRNVSITSVPLHLRGRAGLFLRLVAKIADAYERELRSTKTIDFEDMILSAAQNLNASLCRHDYKFVIVDEFQDLSPARAKLIDALLQARAGTKLFAVGDDWQSIYRFAGSDIGYMTRFEEAFGAATVSKLTTSYRSKQAIVDFSSVFVMKNPQQIRKAVVAADTDTRTAVSIVTYDGRASKIGAIAKIAGDIAERAGRKRASVLFLGRYNRLSREVPKSITDELRQRHEVSFLTCHGSKGVEADYVIVLGLENGTFGFPTEVVDDPLLALAMPSPETYPNAEERRLFYVAVSRAREHVYLMGDRMKPSSFLTELFHDAGFQYDRIDMT